MSGLEASEVDGLRRLKAALEALDCGIVVVGGIAVRLLRFHPLAQRLEWDPLVTNDVDLAIAAKATPKVEIDAAFEAQGFVERLDGLEHPPICRYLRGDFEVELLMPMERSASTKRRTPSPIATLRGSTAQRLDDFEPLLDEPISLDIPDVGALLVASPAAYLIQKLLSLPARSSPGDKRKDVVYLHDVVVLFGTDDGLHPEVRAHAARIDRTLTESQRSKIARTIESISDAEAPLVRGAEKDTIGFGRPQTAIQLATKLAELRRLLPR